MKLYAKVALAALALTLVPAALAEARPNRGVWKGYETAEFINGRYVNFSAAEKETLPVKFRVRGRARRIRNFTATEFEYTCRNAAGEELAKYDVTPEFRRLRKHRGGRFSAKVRDNFDGRAFRTYVKGQFSSPRRARGKLKLKVSGCSNPVATKWRATGPRRRRPSGGGGGGGDSGRTYCPPHVKRDAYGNATAIPGYYSYSGCPY